MKKVLSIVLSLVLVICMMPVMAFAGSNDAVYSDIAGEKCEGAVSVLSALGVVDGYENGTYKPEQTVTRAEMAKLVITALGMDSYATATKSSYSDMANAQWAIPVVEYATNLGIIEGVGGGRFSPGNPVTYEQAATMIVRAIGFTTDCNEMNGTWPAIYVQKATALGLFENVEGNNYGTGANRGDVAIMLYNALNTPMVYADKDGQTLTKFGKDGDVITMMTTLNKNGTVEYGVLTPEDADDALTNVRSLIGAAGKIIKNKDGKVLSIGDIQTQFLTGEYNAATEKFTVGDTEYSIASKPYSEYGYKDSANKDWSVVTKPATDDKVVNFKNNEKTSKDFDLATLQPSGKGTYTLAVKVSGKTIKNIYSIAKWDATQGSVKKATASQLKKITSDKSLLTYEFAKNDDGEIDTASFILNGVDKLADIEADDIVAVYATTENVITKVEVGTEVVTGKVTKVKTATDGTKTYTVNDKEYKVSGLPGNSVALNVGDEATLYLDYAGKIYVTDEVESDSSYGIVLVAPAKDGDDTFGGSYKVKLFTEKGEAEVLTIKNDTLGKDLADLSLAAGTLVEYKLNADGKVSAMEAAPNANNPAGSKYNNGVIDGKICADDMVVFVKGSRAADKADTYDLAKAENITDAITAGSYCTNNDSDITAILVDESATNSSDLFGFLNSRAEIKNDKDEPVFEVTGVANGKEITEQTDDATEVDFPIGVDSFGIIKMSGGVVSEVVQLVAGTNVEKSDSVKDTFATGKEAVMFTDGVAVGKFGTTGQFDAFKVMKVNGDRVLVSNNKAGTTEGNYQTVKDATVYIPTLNSDNTFDAWTVGSVDDIEIEGFVVLLQTNKKSANWDTVIFIPDTVERDADLIK